MASVIGILSKQQARLVEAFPKKARIDFSMQS